MGSRLNVKLACLTLAFFHALLQRGLERAHAIEIIAELQLDLLCQLGRSCPFLGGRGVTTHFGDLKRGEVVSLLFPFNPPGYIAKWIGGDSEVGYDVVRFPVAEYFRAHDAADLCVSSWCNLDFPLGEMLGWKLTREKTLVLGDDRCSFRWKRVAPLAAKPRGGQR
jgi:hypothetical protein